MRRANLQACGTERGVRRAPRSAAPRRVQRPPGRDTHLDHLRLGVLQVQQQRHQPVEDLLEENLAVAFAEPAQVAEEHDGRVAELGLLLRAEGRAGSAGTRGRWGHAGTGDTAAPSTLRPAPGAGDAGAAGKTQDRLWRGSKATPQKHSSHPASSPPIPAASTPGCCCCSGVPGAAGAPGGAGGLHAAPRLLEGAEQQFAAEVTPRSPAGVLGKGGSSHQDRSRSAPGRSTRSIQLPRGDAGGVWGRTDCKGQ